MATANPPPIYELGPDFYDEAEPARFPTSGPGARTLRYRNQTAAKALGLDTLSEEEWLKHFYDFQALPENIAKPLALRYHGHQFRHYNPDLGDGRGFLFAQFQVGKKLLDLGTKGSGQTPYSRRGDGRLTLKGAFREILATELLESYGVNTSKTFSVIETGENLERHDEPSPTRAAVLVRLNHSHIRFGTFQRLAHLGQTENIKKLLAYCVRHFYPQLQGLDEVYLPSAFLQLVSEKVATMTAQWMTAGFVHGVLNSDNMNITGESFDYGPYRFLPHYDPGFTAAYFDHQGLYAFGRQPMSSVWNLQQLGLSLQKAYPELDINSSLEGFGPLFNDSFQEHLLIRLNLARNEDQLDSLVAHLFRFLEQEKVPFEQTLFDLHSGAIPERLQRSPLSAVYNKPSFADLKNTLSKFQVRDLNKVQHHYFGNSKPCSLIIDELESIWAPIAEKDDWSLFEKKLEQIRSFRGLYSCQD